MSTGNNYVPTGTIGQPDTGTATGGDYVLQGGFAPTTRSATLGPAVRANGERGTVAVTHGQPVTITVTMAAGEYIGVNADWWVVAIPSYGAIWYYLDSLMEWVDFPANDLTAMQPALQGPLMDVPYPVTMLPAMALPRGTYMFYFAVDQMDGILNYPDGPILLDLVTVVVE